MALEFGLVASDCHRPFHCRKAWAIFTALVEQEKPKYIVLNGDYVDFYALSRHDKDPARIVQFEYELTVAREGLRELEQLAPQAKLIYIDGNHEDRLRRYLWTKAPELSASITTPGLLDLSRWTHVGYKKHWRLGKMHYTHDVGATGRQAVARALDTYQHCVTTGHSHRFQTIVEGNALGESKVSASYGHMCDVDQVDYMHEAKAKKDWAVGFGVFWHDTTSGVVYTQPIPIIHGKALFHGKIYQG